jgi:antibiotic biosynthesis monooxygenase (ABM) superfamily enzyme
MSDRLKRSLLSTLIFLVFYPAVVLFFGDKTFEQIRLNVAIQTVLFFPIMYWIVIPLSNSMKMKSKNKQ